MARLNICSRIGTILSDRELKEFRDRGKGVVNSSFFYHFARHFIHGTKIPEGMLNRVEAVIRAFDPCLSCSTHAVGQMPLQIQLFSEKEELIDTVTQN